MIRRSGENISSREIEAVVLMLDEIEDAAAVPVADSQRGEEVKLYVQLKPGFSPSDCSIEHLENHCRHLLAPFKVPRYYAYIETFPRTSSDKIAKHILIGSNRDLRHGSYDRIDAVWR
jgi:acyl-coenzyme A synthetase/AMP-(fatty) acid ligase